MRGEIYEWRQVKCFLLVITLSVIQHNDEASSYQRVNTSGSVLNAGVTGEDPAAASRDRHHVYCIILFTIFLDKLVLSNL